MLPLIDSDLLYREDSKGNVGVRPRPANSQVSVHSERFC